LHDRPPALVGELRALLAWGDRGRAVRHRQPYRFEGGGHGVRREHPAAGPIGRAGVAFQLLELGEGHGPPRHLAHRLEDVLYRHVLAVPLAGWDAPTIEVDTREVRPRHRHRA